MDDQTLIARAREYISLEQDEFFRRQVEKLVADNDTAELNDRFFRGLEFGTGGLRGVIGGGYNRMNSYTVKRATQGLANHIKKNVPGLSRASVVIAYDSRNFSDVFSLTAALTLCANGIRAYLFTGLRPTPELSFAVRHLKATAGIVITASHNPPEYNGYKAYWSDGGQVLPPHDAGIIREAGAVTGMIAEMPRDDAAGNGSASGPRWSGNAEDGSPWCIRPSTAPAPCRSPARSPNSAFPSRSCRSRKNRTEGSLRSPFPIPKRRRR
jgi:phosphoglucomutase